MSNSCGSGNASRTESASAGSSGNRSSIVSGASSRSRPGASFAFVRWTGNDYGTVLSRIVVLRAVMPGERYVTVPYVRPSGESLLRVSGWPKVEKVLQAIDAIEALGIDPADAAPDHWQHIHNRLSVGEQPRPYTHTRHQAWLHRRRLTS